MILTYKTRLEPNNKQAQKLRQFAGAARYASNWTLAKQNTMKQKLNRSLKAS